MADITGREVLGNLVNAALNPLGAELRSLRNVDSLPLWKGDETFVPLAQTVRNHSLLSPERLYVLWQFARYANALHHEGDYAEVGVWRGGGSYLIASVCYPRTVHVFDTFTGLPEADADRIAKGAFADTSVEVVRRYLELLGTCVVYPGLFPGTAQPIAHRQFCLVHLDVDLYSSTRDGLIFFYERMVPGGVIVVDDYRTRHQGVTHAVDEFLQSVPEMALVLAPGQCVIIKHRSAEVEWPTDL